MDAIVFDRGHVWLGRLTSDPLYLPCGYRSVSYTAGLLNSETVRGDVPNK